MHIALKEARGPFLQTSWEHNTSPDVLAGRCPGNHGPEKGIHLVLPRIHPPGALSLRLIRQGSEWDADSQTFSPSPTTDGLKRSPLVLDERAIEIHARRHSNIQVMPQSECTRASTNEAQVGSVDRSSLALRQFRVAHTERMARTEKTGSGMRWVGCLKMGQGHPYTHPWSHSHNRGTGARRKARGRNSRAEATPSEK